MAICDGIFWDNNVTWNTAVPDFTLCFQNAILVALPCFIFWAVAAISLSVAWGRSTNISVPWTPLPVVKLVCCALIICLCCTELGFFSYKNTPVSNSFKLDVFAACIKIVTYVLVVIVQLRNRVLGKRSSTILLLFWFVMSLSGIVLFRSTFLKISDTKFSTVPKFKYVLDMIYFPLLFCQLIFALIPEKTTGSHLERQSPFDEASFLSFLTFYWFYGIISKGKKKILNLLDFPPLPSKMDSKYVWQLFKVNWSKESNKRKAVDDSLEQSPRLALVIFKTFWPWILASCAFQLFYNVLLVAIPLLLNLLLDFISDRNNFAWQGYFLCFLLFFSDNLSKLAINFMLYYSACFALQFKSVVSSAIYRKAMKISNAARKEYTTGEIVNLVSVDVEKVYIFFTHFSFLIGSPVKVILSLVLLWKYLGPSCLSGVAVVILMIFLTFFVTKKVKMIQVKQMDTKDLRLKFMTEILNGIKVLKLYAWEIPFMKKITDIREDEVNLIRSFKIFYALFSFVWRSAGFLVALASFVTFILVNKEHLLNPVTVFVSLNVLNNLRYAVAEVPALISDVIQSKVSLKRITVFLTADERNDTEIGTNPNEGEVISVKNASLGWSAKEKPILRNIDFHVPRGSLVAVIGAVGSGKSSLLSAILGEMHKFSGSIDSQGQIAYVPQQAWILNQSLKQNILFMSTMSNSKYESILENCCLKPDLEILPAGDNTEIGEKGVNLSGGQKQRVSLARAVYHDADVYLLDDPLSAVDSSVGKHVFDHVLSKNGLLRNKSRVLVTHNIHIISEADLIITMNDGAIEEVGTYDELMTRDGVFAKLIREYATPKEASDDQESDEDSFHGGLKQRKLIERSMSAQSEDQESTSALGTAGKLTEEEKMEIGEVNKSALITYAKKMSVPFFVLMVLGYISNQSFEIGANVWLSKWSNDPEPVNGTQDIALRNTRIEVYAGLGLGQIICIIFSSVSLAFGATKAAKSFHLEMMRSVLRAPMSFFDVTPLGRILNRFSKDMDDIDTAIPQEIDSVLYFLFATIGTMIVIASSTPLFIPFLVPIIGCYYVIQRVYLVTSCQLKRFSAVTRSPVYSHFTESIQGASSINAYKVMEHFTEMNEHKINSNTNSEFLLHTCTRWFDVNLAAISDSIVLLASLLAVLSKDHIDAAVVGLSVTYALSVTDILSFLIRNGTELENRTIAVERITEYSNLQSEAPWEIDEQRPPSAWPMLGEIEFKSYSTRYRENLDLVLRNVDFKINENEKLGIVGRTGAGKSSFALALFRIIEPSSGTIDIDNVDISQIGLQQLRSKLTIIPQDPTLFSGSLRFNLDPNDEHTDSDVFLSLEHANMKDFVRSLEDGLAHDISEGGTNLSVGQRQLICLARALLKKSKILVLDEATAAVDVETDSYIQNTIRTEFKNHTVITVAHRLNTIMDYDRVLVLEDGKITEADKPSKLLEDVNSRFYIMAKDAGLT